MCQDYFWGKLKQLDFEVENSKAKHTKSKFMKKIKIHLKKKLAVSIEIIWTQMLRMNRNENKTHRKKQQKQ